MVEVIAVHRIAIDAGQTYTIGGEEITAAESTYIEPDQTFGFPEGRADILLEKGAVKLPPKSKQKGARRSKSAEVT